MTEPTMKSTKQEIMDAYQSVRAELEKRKAIIGDPAAQKAADKDKVVEQAKQDVQADIFSEKMTAKFNNLTEAIAIQEQRLTTLYDVEKAMLDMETTIAARKEALMKLDAELESRRTEIQEELAEMERAANEKARETEMARKREAEEFNYNLNRARAKDADEYADRLADNEKVIAEKLEAVKAREVAVHSREEEIAEMEAKIAAFPDELQAKYEQGVTEGTATAKKSAAIEKAMAEKDRIFAAEKADLELDMLKKQLEQKTAQVAALESKLDKAYASINELAVNTANAQGGVKILNADTQRK